MLGTVLKILKPHCNIFFLFLSFIFFFIKPNRDEISLYFTLYICCRVALRNNASNCDSNKVRCPYFAVVSRLLQGASMSDITIKCQSCLYFVALLRLAAHKKYCKEQHRSEGRVQATKKCGNAHLSCSTVQNSINITQFQYTHTSYLNLFWTHH